MPYYVVLTVKQILTNSVPYGAGLMRRF